MTDMEAMNDEDFLQYFDWLHRLTLAGYKRKIILKTLHGHVIKDYYDSGCTVEQALEKYIAFESRYNDVVSLLNLN